ncbi:MAG: response regulator [Xenococcaceae cyanobacterium]
MKDFNMPARILVVDDEPSLEKLLNQNFHRQIEEREYEFIYARNGQEALDKIEQKPPDLMLADIKMPKMNGLTLLNYLNQKHINIKTIIISAYGTQKNIRRAMQERAFNFLTKPIKRKELEKAIERVLNFRNQKVISKATLPERPKKVDFRIIWGLVKGLPPSQQSKIVHRLIENFAPEQIDISRNCEAIPSLGLRCLQ